MVKVYVRHADQVTGSYLGEVPLTAEGLDGAFALVKHWGVAVDDDAGTDPVDFMGQFRLTELEAYFEIVLAFES